MSDTSSSQFAALAMIRSVRRDRESKRRRMESTFGTHKILPTYMEYAYRKPPTELDRGHAAAERFFALLKIYDSVDGQKMKRTPQQSILHNMLFAACLRMIYSSKIYEEYEATILEKFNLAVEETKQFIKVITTRRMGKSLGFSMFAVVLLLCIPKIRVAVFSPGQNQSNNIIDMVALLLDDRFPHIKYQKSASKLEFWASPTDKRTITAYSSSVRIRCFSLSLSLFLSPAKTKTTKNLTLFGPVVVVVVVF
jgi:hypothetical protein